MNMLINNEAELEEVLSRPGEKDIEAMAALDGDVLILGVGGKMGPSLAKLARRAADASGTKKRIIAVARFSVPQVRDELTAAGIETIPCDLLEPGALAGLPDVPNVIFMAARKFGTTGARASDVGDEHVRARACGRALSDIADRRVLDRQRVSACARCAAAGSRRQRRARLPIGEYAQSALGRERMFEYVSEPLEDAGDAAAPQLRQSTCATACWWTSRRRCARQQPVDLRMGDVNVIWQGDANSYVPAVARALCQSPPLHPEHHGSGDALGARGRESFGERFGNAAGVRRARKSPTPC